MPGARQVHGMLVALIVAGAVLPAAVSGAGAGVQPATSGANGIQPTVDNTVTRIDVAADGSATWVVAVRTRLETDEDVTNYEAFQQRFRENTSRYLDPYRERISDVVARASNATGREMRATNFSASTSIQELPRRWGVVTYRFTWSGFAATDGDAVAVGDVFQGGYYLAENDILELSGPAEYSVGTFAPEPDSLENGTLQWTGPRDFDDEHPRARYEPVTTNTTTAPPATDERQSGGSLLWLGAAGVLLVAVAAGVLAYRRRGPSTVEEASGASTVDQQSVPGPVTDEERVRSLLAERGGRMAQAELGDELDWSASKTSRVVSRLADDGDVEKLRLGRKNVIELVEEP